MMLSALVCAFLLVDVTAEIPTFAPGPGPAADAAAGYQALGGGPVSVEVQPLLSATASTQRGVGWGFEPPNGLSDFVALKPAGIPGVAWW